MGLAAMLALAEQIGARGISLPVDVWWVATVGEEGLGDLRGIRRACERLGDQIGVAIILEGLGFGRVYHIGLGVRRLRVTVRGPGGHSWGHAGRPSAIHHLLRMGAALVDETEVPDEPRTVLNVGLISGGTSINTIAAEASFAIDMRSVDADSLVGLESQVMEIVGRFSDSPDLEVMTEVVGDRPSAMLSAGHPLVQAAQGALHYVGHDAPSLEIGSTDANITLARGIPSVCVGVTKGGNPHALNEYIEIAPLVMGMRQLTLLALLAVENMDDWRVWDRG
jgi:acetylornithine deacetylase/succinyl-diaminopimelate desuccinylase-like protein